MHILLGILGIVASVSYYLIVIRRVGGAAGDAIDVAQRARGKFRRKAFSKKVDGSVLTAVDDPGTAATVLLIKLVEMKQPLTETTRGQIVTIVEDEIGMPDAPEVVAFAQWVCDQGVEGKDILRNYKSLWQDRLSSKERADFISIAERLAHLDGEPTHQQSEILIRLHEVLA